MLHPSPPLPFAQRSAKGYQGFNSSNFHFAEAPVSFLEGDLQGSQGRCQISPPSWAALASLLLAGLVVRLAAKRATTRPEAASLSRLEQKPRSPPVSRSELRDRYHELTGLSSGFHKSLAPTRLATQRLPKRPLPSGRLPELVHLLFFRSRVMVALLKHLTLTSQRCLSC